MELQDTFLRAILATVARQTFSPVKILEIIGPGEKQHRAFNLCDGEKTQAEIAKELGLDPGNFSRTVTRWVDEGIAIRAGKKGDTRPLHVYPLPEALIKKGTKK
jgi:DNA-binding MarR family transcriptional regulator